MSHSELADLRLKLVAAREGLHEDEASLAILSAHAEQEIIDALPGETPEQREKALGANVEARKRALAIGLGDHADYQDLLRSIRRGKAWIEDFQARIDNLLDERKDREIQARERLVDVLAQAYGVVLTPTESATDAALQAEAEEAAIDRLPGVPAEDDSRDIDDEDRAQAAALRIVDALADGRDDLTSVVADWSPPLI